MYASRQLPSYGLWSFSAVEGVCDVSKTEFYIENSDQY